MTQQLDRVEEKIDKINEHLVKLTIDSNTNTNSLTHHILRTDILESRQNKIIWALLVLAGAAGSSYYPQIMKIIGTIL